MSDISTEALDKALAKVKQLVPNAGKIEVLVCLAHSLTASFPFLFILHNSDV